MEDIIEVHFTSGSIDEARKIARYLVQEKLVACAQIIPWIESVFMWNGQLDTAQESKVILKTIKAHYERIKQVIEENCRYEIPEIAYHEVDELSPAYRQWLLEVTNNQ